MIWDCIYKVIIMKPVTNDQYQMALFRALMNMFSNSGEAIFYFKQVHDNDLFEFESLNKRFAIKTSLLTPQLINCLFNIHDQVRCDHERKKELFRS